MRRLSLTLLFLLAFSSSAFALEDPTYVALRSARLDGRVSNVQNLVIQRDAMKFTFESGAFHLLAPIGDRTVGAVFIGKGQYSLLPSTEAERKHLNLVTGKNELETLEDSFEEMVLLFGDTTASDIEKSAPSTRGAADARASKIYESYLERQKSELRLNLHLRVLQDLLNGVSPSRGFFAAFVDGKSYPPALYAFDHQGVGNVAAKFALLGGEQSILVVIDENDGGIWYLSRRKGEAKSGVGRAFRPHADALHYTIDTTIEKNNKIRGKATIRIVTVTPTARVLPVHILPKLRIEKVELSENPEGGTWVEIPFVQETLELGVFKRMFQEEATDSDAAVVFLSAVAAGTELSIRFEYSGDEVLRDAGDKNYYVGARESWYPNFGAFVDLATFELTFRTRKDHDLVSVGKSVEERVEGDQKISVWKSDIPMRVAGFNYGKFKKVGREDSGAGVRIEVYTNPGTPNIIREINDRLGGGASALPGDVEQSGGGSIHIDTRRLAESALVDAINTARVGKIYFGDVPYTPVSITQQSEWSFGQSWPSLIYLPYLAFIDSTTRMQLFGDAAKFGLKMSDMTASLESLGAHEFAHQWWGHQVGWESYRDQWLSEGFAQFSAALVLQHTVNLKKYDAFWESQRRLILERRPGGIANYEAGAISQGWRSSTRRSPAAGFAMIYAKGGYVLHMLRMMMRDPSSKGPDQKFIGMMRDFVATYSGRNPSTADFQKVVEKHMIPAMNQGGNNTMDWFFKQWVHGTDIPKFSHTLQVTDLGGGKYKVSGSIKQEGVGSDFRTLVPIYVDFGKDQLAEVGGMPIVGNATRTLEAELKLPKKPSRVLVNAMHDILARD